MATPHEVLLQEQPTQTILLEEQNPVQRSRGLSNSDKEDLERQPTQSINVPEQVLAQQPTQPINAQQANRRLKVRRKWVLLALNGILAVAVLIGLLAVQGWLPLFAAKSAVPAHTSRAHTRRFIAHASPIDVVIQHFMDAMMHKDWATMWSMLSPDAQQLWQGEEDFLHFEQAKFGSLKFLSYAASPSQVQKAWPNPDTTQTYPEAVVLHIALQATAPPGLLTAPSAAALKQGLFKNTLFALVPYQDTWRVLVAGPADLDAPILVPASPPATKLLVPIFMYHHVSNKPTYNALDYGLTVTTTNFNAQLTWLQQQGYHTITQVELFDALYYGKKLPPHPMMLTFDDGYEDAYTDALPTLLAHHYRGVFYIITGMIGGRYMTWDQVRTLARDGMEIASHTVHHVNIGEPPAFTTTQKELLDSKRTLEAELGRTIQFFCYPTGEPFHHDTVAEQQMVLADLYNDGYVSATLDPFYFVSAIQDAQTPYQLPRIRVSGGESLSSYVGILNATLRQGAAVLANGA